MSTPETLAHVQKTAINLARWKRERHWAILAAHADGHSNRQIANAAGLTHPAVTAILKLDPPAEPPQTAVETTQPPPEPAPRPTSPGGYPPDPKPAGKTWAKNQAKAPVEPRFGTKIKAP